VSSLLTMGLGTSNTLLTSGLGPELAPPKPKPKVYSKVAGGGGGETPHYTTQILELMEKGKSINDTSNVFVDNFALFDSTFKDQESIIKDLKLELHKIKERMAQVPKVAVFPNFMKQQKPTNNLTKETIVSIITEQQKHRIDTKDTKQPDSSSSILTIFAIVAAIWNNKILRYVALAIGALILIWALFLRKKT